MKDLIKKFIPSFLVSWYHFLLAFLGAFFYGFPSRKITVIGVTGTSGKTTVVDMVSRIFEERGYETAALSSIKFKIGSQEEENKLKMTMPGRFKLQKFLKKAKTASCKYVVLEVTSEGIKQYRHKFIDFEMAVFTNLSPEHIESHGGFEKYRAAKLKLFRTTRKIHIINTDDENAKYFLEIPAKEKWEYGIKGQESRTENQKFIKATDIKVSSTGISFIAKNTQFNLNLLGGFNIYNSLAAICVGLSQGISLETCKLALKKIKRIPGRMEEVISKPFRVIVDYAITPNALEKVYQTLTTHYKLPTTNLICVLGSCGGGRDKWKRPVLGKIAAKYCDEVIVTNEDPYNEDPMEIINQVAEGAGGKVQKILDRREAVSKALKIAKDNDVVVITGKGCEPWMCLAKGKKIPWDDRQIVREEFNKIKK